MLFIKQVHFSPDHQSPTVDTVGTVIGYVELLHFEIHYADDNVDLTVASDLYKQMLVPWLKSHTSSLTKLFKSKITVQEKKMLFIIIKLEFTTKPKLYSPFHQIPPGIDS